MSEHTIPLTSSHGQGLGDIIGKVVIVEKGINPIADKVWTMYKDNPEDFSFEPEYIKKDDDTVELLALSLVLNKRPSTEKGSASSR